MTLFGLAAVTAMLVCYALEKSSHRFRKGAWPFRLVDRFGLWWQRGVGESRRRRATGSKNHRPVGRLAS